MQDDRTVPPEDIREETDAFTGGPGVAATKSQARGSLLGGGLGIVAGAIIGVIVGLLASAILGFEQRGVIISIVVFGVAGVTFGGVAGGFLRPRQKLPKSEADT